MGSRGFSERYGRLGHIIGRQILEKKAEIYAFVDQVGLHRGTDNDFKAELSIADTELDRGGAGFEIGSHECAEDRCAPPWRASSMWKPTGCHDIMGERRKLKGIKIHRFDGEMRRRSDLPPPGVAPRLWGAENSSVLRAFEHL